MRNRRQMFLVNLAYAKIVAWKWYTLGKMILRIQNIIVLKGQNVIFICFSFFLYHVSWESLSHILSFYFPMCILTSSLIIIIFKLIQWEDKLSLWVLKSVLRLNHELASDKWKDMQKKVDNLVTKHHLLMSVSVLISKSVNLKYIFSHNLGNVLV